MAIGTPETATPEIVSRPGTPTWEIAHLFPTQGNWSEQEYLALDTNRLIEFTDGCLKFLPIPSWFHQLIVKFLFGRLNEFIDERGLGELMFAPLPIRVGPKTYREPDLVFLGTERLKKLRDLTSAPDGADLIMEVVSPGQDARKRDLEDKRRDYAAAGIAEYWIVDPERQTITVLALPADGGEYELHGEVRKSETANSRLLDGFSVDVSACFAVGNSPGSGSS